MRKASLLLLIPLLLSCGDDDKKTPTGPDGGGGGTTRETMRFTFDYCEYDGGFVWDNPSPAMAQKLCVELGYDGHLWWEEKQTTCNGYSTIFMTAVMCYRDR